jgi:hypothetical protein
MYASCGLQQPVSSVTRYVIVTDPPGATVVVDKTPEPTTITGFSVSTAFAISMFENGDTIKTIRNIMAVMERLCLLGPEELLLLKNRSRTPLFFLNFDLKAIRKLES